MENIKIDGNILNILKSLKRKWRYIDKYENTWKYMERCINK